MEKGKVVKTSYFILAMSQKWDERKNIVSADAAQWCCHGTRTSTRSGTKGLQSRQAIPTLSTMQQQEQFLNIQH